MSPVPFFTAGGLVVFMLLFGVPYPLVIVGEVLLTLKTNGRAALVLPWVYTGAGLLLALVFLLNFVGVGIRGILSGPGIRILLGMLLVVVICCLPALLLWGVYALCRHIRRKNQAADELKRMEIQDL